MEIINTIPDLRRARRALAGSVGLVPTMGYLHAGHLALIEQAAHDNDHVVVSIFVNPTQFGPNDDFASYPRDTDHDLALLKTARVSLVFMPIPADMYPAGFQTTVEVGTVAQVLEGAHRPGHFRGVATVVSKLFNLIQPDSAYFGQKDAQQAIVIQQMARDLNFPLAIEVVPIQREPDGLALSSRNVYLTADQRAAAVVIYRALQATRARFDAGERRADALRQVMLATLATEPLAEIEYVSLADAETLQEITNESINRRALLSLAVRFGRTRLIDNLLLG
jgi:pantoate--beta-alanine ligase